MLGDRLKELRISKNYTQDDLAQKLKISKSTIGMYEQNRRSPDLETLVKFADIFNISTDFLLEHNDQSNILKWEEVKISFPSACNLSKEEKDIILYYRQLSKTDKRWIMGQLIDLKKKEDDGNLTITKTQ